MTIFTCLLCYVVAPVTVGFLLVGVGRAWYWGYAGKLDGDSRPTMIFLYGLLGCLILVVAAAVVGLAHDFAPPLPIRLQLQYAKDTRHGESGTNANAGIPLVPAQP